MRSELKQKLGSLSGLQGAFAPEVERCGGVWLRPLGKKQSPGLDI